MEEAVELGVLAEANVNDIEDIIIGNVIGNREINNINGRLPRFNLEDFSDEEIKTYFRFERNDLYRLVELINLPHLIRTPSGNSVTGMYV